MSGPATVCFFNTTRAWGGGEKWHYEMAAGIDRSRFRPVVVASPGSELARRTSRADIELREMDISNISFLDPARSRKIRRFFSSENVRAVIINLPSDLKAAAPAAQAAGVPRVIYRRGSAIPIRDSWLNRRIFGRYVTDIIVNSEETGRTILQNNPRLFDAGRIRVIYNGIDLEEWDARPLSPCCERRPGELVISSAGRLEKQKGQDMLIEAAAILKQKGLGFRVILAGEGRLESRLRALAAERGVSEEIVFTGFLDNVRDLMEPSDMFVLPSLWEGFGYVLVEAMACSKPVVAFNVSSNPEIVEDGATGYLAEQVSAEALAEKILDLAGDPGLMSTFGERGRLRVEKLFTMEKALGELEAYLSDLLG